ncbi:MAG: hypothetical protein Q8N18_07520 [Opitutaceae bacterium]|nr:hypothetical protein [Opitutaceae bacterium]
MATTLTSFFPFKAQVLLAALTLLGATAAGYAQQGKAAEKKAHSYGEKLSEAFTKMKPLQDAQDYPGMIKLLESVPVVPGSYDEASVLNTKARIYAATSKYSDAMKAWERVVQLNDQSEYFAEKDMTEVIFFLAQLNAQEASGSKDPKIQSEYFKKSVGYFRRYFDKTPKPSPDIISTYASILYYSAVADPNNIDHALLKETRTIIDRALTSAIKPKESFYQLYLALLQQQNDLVASSEILELVLKQNPAKKDYWAMLFAIYLQLNDKAREKDPGMARDYLVRAIVTLERAQALGFLNTPKDNMNLVSFYLLANQFTKGTELLYSGMKKGTIESEPHNWRILGRYYQEANLYQQAVTVLKEATALFPTNGELEVQIAQIYLQMEKTREAFTHAKLAVSKGNFKDTKPYGVHYLRAYTAYELGDLEESMKALEEAQKFSEHEKDTQFARLKEVVGEALNEKAEKAKAKETPKKADASKAPSPTSAAPATKTGTPSKAATQSK